MLVNAKAEDRADYTQRVECMTAGSAPPAAVLEGMERMGFKVTHVYGLTECYGPAVVCAWHEEWNGLPECEQADIKARQGVRYPVLEGLTVADPETLVPVPADGATMGEVMMRGNVVMKGYLKNPSATAKAFAGGWFHTGDLGVMHPDGYIQLKDRSKDIIISGGENISSIEVEGVLYRHPAVLEAAVVARRTRNGARRRAPSSRSRTASARPSRRSSRSAASTWRTSRRRRRWCSGRCPRPRPARCRNSCCASRPRGSARRRPRAPSPSPETSRPGGAGATHGISKAMRRGSSLDYLSRVASSSFIRSFWRLRRVTAVSSGWGRFSSSSILASRFACLALRA